MPRLRDFLFSALVTASAGTIWTGALAWIRIDDNDYLAHGLHRNAIRVFQHGTVRGALAGAFLGIALLLFAGTLRSLRRFAPPGRASSLLPYLLYLCFTLIVIAAHALATYGEIDMHKVEGIYAMALVWCGLLWVKRHRFVARRPLLSALAATTLCLIPPLTLAVVFLITRHNEALLWRAETIAAAALTYFAGFVVAVRFSSPTSATTPGPLWLLALPALVLPILLLVAPLVLVSNSAAGRPANVLLIGIDTVRFDHTSLGDPSARDTTPNLAKLAAAGTLFETAISQAPWTMPSFASVMTGRYPREHGAISLNGELRPAEITLAEVLREAGYDTAAIVSHNFVDAVHGFAQGFDLFDATNVRQYWDITSADVSDAALEYLAGRRGRPFFLFLHYFDPHWMYRDHRDFTYADAYQGWLRGPYRLDISDLRDRRHELSDTDLSYLRALYDEEIAFTDSQIGRLLAYLRRSGLDENTIVVVVADHGEEFMERGWLGHTISLYDEQIHVPLIISLPAGEPHIASVETPVETRAIPATVLDYLQLKQPAAPLQGSLLRLIRGEAPGTSDGVAFSEVWLPDRGIDRRLRMSSLRTERWKFVKDFTRNVEHLYDLADDPQELEDVVETDSGQARELREALATWLRSMEAAGGEIPINEPTNEELRTLRSLGYVN